MKVKIEETDHLEEIEIVIYCKQKNKEIKTLEYNIEKIIKLTEKLIFLKDGVEYYLPLDQILFFETEGNQVVAHTKEDIFFIKYKLYELEELLPKYFVRAAKSTIINCNHIYAIDKNLTSSSSVKFNQSYKQVYISRFYYKEVKKRLMERSKENEK